MRSILKTFGPFLQMSTLNTMKVVRLLKVGFFSTSLTLLFHFLTHQHTKDLIFGVPLSFTFRNLPAVLPPFLKNSIEQIDKRGLHVEGLYRVSAKNSDRDKARIELETDLNAFNWEIADIHLLTGLVKAYLRELPEPLFPFPRADRDAYSATNNEATRLVKLTTMVRGLQRNNMTALKFLLEHLNRQVLFLETFSLIILTHLTLPLTIYYIQSQRTPR